MTKIIVAYFLAMLLLFAAADQAFARGAGGGGSSGRTSYSRSNKSRNTTGFIHKTCKSSACFKKHPSGHYAIPLHSKK